MRERAIRRLGAAGLVVNTAHDAVTCDEWQTTALLAAGN
jgi:hypothetical protein